LNGNSSIKAVFIKKTVLNLTCCFVRKIFQVLRLPWMAEVLEPPGAAPVKTWKVCLFDRQGLAEW